MFFSFGLLLLLCLILWIWALVDIIQSRFSDDSTKIIWCLLVIFLPFIGTFLYYVIGETKGCNNRWIFPRPIVPNFNFYFTHLLLSESPVYRIGPGAIHILQY